MPKVRVIDETGKNLGVLDTEKALALAKERGFNLIEISPKAQPPVCKILDYGRYKYQMMKKEQKLKKKQKRVAVKGIRISLRTSEHDLTFKAGQANKFIKQGHKVRIELALRGREWTHRDLVKKKFDEFIGKMKEKVKIEQEPKKQRLGLAMIITKTS